MAANIGEVRVECYEDALFRRRGGEQAVVIGTNELLVTGGDNIMTASRSNAATESGTFSSNVTTATSSRQGNNAIPGKICGVCQGRFHRLVGKGWIVGA